MANMNEIERALAEPIDKSLIKRRKVQGDKVASYITARTVMNRLDSVVGPSGWYDTYRPIAGGVECTLFIRFGDEWIGKTDAAEETKIEPVKGAYSDALKRAACKWGIARELYQEGTALDDDDTPPSAPASQPKPQRRIPEPETPVTRAERSTADEPDQREAAKEMPIVVLEQDAIVDRAQRTFPFAKEDKGVNWQEYAKAHASWPKKFWPATKALGYKDNDEVHAALSVISVNDWNGTVSSLWFAIVKAAPPEQQELRPTG